MPKAGTKYGPGGKFKSLTEAYLQYERDRIKERTNPTLAPQKKFGVIWGWGKKKKA